MDNVRYTLTVAYDETAADDVGHYGSCVQAALVEEPLRWVLAPELGHQTCVTGVQRHSATT